MSRLTPTPAEIHKHLLLLEDTPRRIGSCTAGLDEGQLHSLPRERAWSQVRRLALHENEHCDQIQALARDYTLS